MSGFPSPDELNRRRKLSKKAGRRRRRTFWKWLADRRAYRARQKEIRSRIAREARASAIERWWLAVAEVDACAEALRLASNDRRYMHRTSKDLAQAVANVYSSRGYTARIRLAYDSSNYSIGQDGWITDSEPSSSKTDLVVEVTWLATAEPPKAQTDLDRSYRTSCGP